MKELKVARAISESSTTSDNTSDFIDIVKKYDVVYNNHNPDYKNVEVKMKVWTQIADEIGLSVEASKRKWKNLRDSYTKYLRSFRVGTKTSKKYQYWAHADHMDFLKPYQGPGRNSVNGNGKSNDEDETDCDFGYQVLAKSTSNGGDDDLKITIATSNSAAAAAHNNSTAHNTQTVNSYTTALSSTSTASSAVLTPSSTTTSATATPPNMISPCDNAANFSLSNQSASSTSAPPVSTSVSSGNNAVVLPLPTMPTMSLSSLPLSAVSKENAAALATLASMGALPLPGASNVAAAAAAAAQQMFPLATLKAAAAAAGLPLPPSCSSTGSNNVGCLVIDPHLFAAADSFKKELNVAAAAAAVASASQAPLGLFQNLTNQAHALSNAASRLSNSNSSCNGTNSVGVPNSNGTPPLLSSKVRRVQPSPHPQTQAINLSTANNASNVALASASQTPAPPPAKTRKLSDPKHASDWDVSAVLQANRELDANTLFFLSLARQVRAMPMKFQSLAKMRCMRIVSDIELELENVMDCNGVPPPEDGAGAANLKYCSIDTPPPPQQHDGTGLIAAPPISMAPDGSTEHFVYVMSPSRVESMIDISSDEDTNMPQNGTSAVGGTVH